MTAIQFAISGAMGRMGLMITKLADTSTDMVLCGGLEYAQSPHQGAACGTGHITDDIAGLSGASVIIDFSRPDATMALIESAKISGQALVIGTTGLDNAQEAALYEAAKTVPILYCANTSMGVNLLMKLVEKAARALGDEWDIEIVETHHNQKIDAPSGTALALGHAAAKGRDVDLETVRQAARDGITGARRAGDIGFAVMRGGNVAGEHSVTFFGEDERIELTHIANQRTIFARGALSAARFMSGKPAGLYTMDDVLGL
ncbi:MAG: 4-hydroxy-tetrahydrodipicolinate reductase [Candidatus Puniceispirillaceae bacterium]